MCFGVDNVKEISNIKIGDGKFAGHGVIMHKHKITGTLSLVASNDTDVMVVVGTALYAKLLYENPGSEPFAIQISGGIEVDEEKPTISWLTKQA